MEEYKKLNEKYTELKTKYTELRERYLELQRYEFQERANWNVLFGTCQDLNIVNEVLKLSLKEKEEKFESEFPPIE